MKHRVNWTERYPGGSYRIIADYTADGWKFSEQDCYELQWFPRTATPELIAKAESLFKQQRANSEVEADRINRKVDRAATSEMISTTMKVTKMKHLTIDGGNVSPTKSEKQWGFETLFAVTSRIALKQVTIKPREALSRQFHSVKDELYLVIEGRGQLELGREAEIVHELSLGDVVHIPPKTIHRLVAADEGIVIIEASTPEVTDIIRLDDRYDRAVNPDIDPAAYGNVIGV